jgi:hypothetical protein
MPQKSKTIEFQLRLYDYHLKLFQRNPDPSFWELPYQSKIQNVRDPFPRKSRRSSTRGILHNKLTRRRFPSAQLSASHLGLFSSNSPYTSPIRRRVSLRQYTAVTPLVMIQHYTWLQKAREIDSRWQELRTCWVALNNRLVLRRGNWQLVFKPGLDVSHILAHWESFMAPSCLGRICLCLWLRSLRIPRLQLSAGMRDSNLEKVPRETEENTQRSS